MTTKRYTALDPQPLARVVVIWLYLHLAATVGNGLMNAWQFADYSRFPADGPPNPDVPSDLPFAFVAIGYLIAAIVCGFLILKWTYRVNRNAHAFARGLDNSPPWSVGWYFVPIANLWKPYQALKQAWQASERPQSWRTVKLPGLMGWWWALWLISSVVGNISFRLFNPQTVGENVLSAGMDMAIAVLDVPLDLVFIQIVRRLTAAQTQQILHQTFSDDDGPAGETTVQLQEA